MATHTSDVMSALHRFRESVVPLPFRLDEDGGTARDGLVFTIQEYVVPRLADLTAPLVVVLLGSTGAGKSTVLNTLAGTTITQPGAIRPTTTDPVVWCHERHAARYGPGFLTGYGDGERALHVVTSEDPLLEHVTMVDTPDIDSVEHLHHEVAADLRRVADVVLFVTSAQRYADQVPWEVLKDVRDRGTPVGFVLNRVPPGAQALVADHDRRLAEFGFDIAPVTVIPELPGRADRDLLPPQWVVPLRAHLSWLGRDGRRLITRRQGLRGALQHMIADSAALQGGLDREQVVVDRLLASVDQAYVVQRDELSQDLARGELIKEEVLDRWQEFVGTGELLKALGGGVERVRSWARTTFGGRPRTEVIRDQAQDEVHLAVMRRAQVASQAVVQAWEQTEAGRSLLQDPAVHRVGEDVDEDVRRRIRVWTTDLAALVEDQGEGRRRIATAASTGVNAAAVIALLATFANTGGITGAEVGITAGAAAAQQRILEHVFGGAAARALVAQGQESLRATLTEVLDAEAARYRRLALSLLAGRALTTGFLRARGQLAVAAQEAGLWTDGLLEEES